MCLSLQYIILRSSYSSYYIILTSSYYIIESTDFVMYMYLLYAATALRRFETLHRALVKEFVLPLCSPAEVLCGVCACTFYVL